MTSFKLREPLSAWRRKLPVGAYLEKLPEIGQSISIEMKGIEMSDRPRWLFWIQATAALIGLIVATNTLLLILGNCDTPLGSVLCVLKPSGSELPEILGETL